ncbi:hypothetical protein IHE55_30330 [Streptomyces pactum]|uniref:SalK n=1 Tax=Streptomyces pactum TaxID=68249 RepID=A0ABS0NUI0_9ACTN|nr:hypothetical protein [Streptomyces pactum]MBH5336954.1 hypothetical protein [Streptomyces pactum]MBH5338838.1 hypothetical protein [Streptomyces pactum]
MTRHQALARRMWHHLEGLHACLYFAPQAFEEAAALGYDNSSRWPSYFAWRAAPLGAAGPELVTATFHSFSPRTVAEHVPGVWSVATPEEVLAARLRAVDRTYRALAPEVIGGREIAEAAALATEAAGYADAAGRPLAAANRDLPWSDEPHLALWQALTVLREHRGDGHLAAVLAAGLDPCESLVSFAAVDAAPEENFAARGWSPEQWAAARERLAERGWVDGAGKATERGRQGRDDIERRTDLLAAGPWRALGEERAERLAALTLPLLAAVFGSGMLPARSTLGIGTVQVTYD